MIYDRMALMVGKSLAAMILVCVCVCIYIDRYGMVQIQQQRISRHKSSWT